jgi:DMSO/TMAO reductase YedYZ molybdopterin-dependent catalytic subunit
VTGKEPDVTQPPDASPDTPIGRRVVLGVLGLGVAGVAAGPWLSRVLGDLSGALSRHDPTGLSSLIPGGGWRYYTVTDGFPYRNPSVYRLTVTGNVSHELTLTTADLLARPRTRLTRDFQCVTGWRVSGVRWEGVTLSSLLDEAGVDSDQKAVQFVSYDGTYTESLTMAEARRDDVLVVDTLDGRPIGRAHGGPVRLLVAPMYGYKSCKWLAAIRVTDRVIPGYWENLGYDQDAWVGRSNGRNDAPT